MECSLWSTAEVLAAIGVITVVAGVIGCAGNQSGTTPLLYPHSVLNVKALVNGTLEYANDYDDGLPLAGKWMDELALYDKDASTYRSPAVAGPGYGYALNSAVVGIPLSHFADPDSTILIFDSTDLSRNATDATTTLPSPPRYITHNTIGYVSGRVQDQPPVSPSLYAVSQSRLKMDALATIMYANDYDEFTPTPNQWMDALAPYQKTKDDFHSPAVQNLNPDNYGYAFNRVVAGINISMTPSPATTLVLFDSTVLSRNATATTTTLPDPPRYGKNNTLAYLDGHVP